MAMLAEPRYHSPEVLDEVFTDLEHFGPSGLPFAGGTDVVVGLRKGKLAPRVMVDLKRVADLAQGIEVNDTWLRIGALTTLSRLVAHPDVRSHFPALVEAANTVGSIQIRNRATLAGNICNASPAADTAPALLAYHARISLVSRHGIRQMPVADFVLGPRRTALRAGEVVNGIDLPLDGGVAGSSFTRLTRRRGVDLATVSVCAVVDRRGTHIAYGAVAPRPFVLTDNAGVLADPHADPAARKALLTGFAAHASPISDLRGSREYRQAMVITCSERALQTAITRRHRP